MVSEGTRQRVLPRGVPVIGLPSEERFGGGDKRPRTYRELAAAGLLAPESDPWLHFHGEPTSSECRIAQWLRLCGVEVRSVAVDVLPTPDAVIDVSGVTVEFKSIGRNVVDPAAALYQRVRHARLQSPRVVADVRGTGATRADANRAVLRALRNGGRDLREVAVVGDAFVLSWP